MVQDNPTIHVWVTKYALTSGVFEIDAVHCVDISDKMITFHRGGYYTEHCHKPHWHTTKAEADAHVRCMIDARLKSLKKSLQRLEALKKQFTA